MSDKGAKEIVEMMDSFFGGDSSEDPRFKFEVGDKVEVFLEPYQYERFPKWKTGYTGKILTRRNAYPPPSFEGYWVPLYYIEGLGELGEGCLRKAKR